MTNFFKRAFNDMKESAKAQHEVEKANFEENRGTNTFRKAKADSKKVWDDAHMSPSERSAKVRKEQQKQIAAAKERTAKANERYENAKVNKQ